MAHISTKGCSMRHGIGGGEGTKARGESGSGGARGEWEETA
jgi:hypothetical protein